MIWRHVMLALPEIDSVPDHVLDRAGRIARGLGAAIELFHCVYDPRLQESAAAGIAMDEAIRGRIGERQRRLERVGDILRQQNVEVRSSVRWDYPIFEAIVREVLRQGPNLLIIPAAHPSHGSAQALAYTDARLIETCPCALLLLKTAKVYSQGPIIAAVDPGHAHEKSPELDETIVAAAKTLSGALSEAPVHLYHAVAPAAEPGAAAREEGGSAEAVLLAQRKPVHWVGRDHEMRKLATRHDLSDTSVRVELGRVECSLPLYAQEVRASAVVMGAVSRSYPDRALFGYTAEKVLDALDCDALIVKPKNFRTPIRRRTFAAGKPKGPSRVQSAQM